MILLWRTLRDLWRLLSRRSRWAASSLVFLLIVSGLFEIISVLFLFGYIAALSDAPQGGNLAIQIYEAIAEGLEGPAFAALAGLVLLAAFALKNLAGLLTSYFLMRFGMKQYERIMARMFEGFLKSPLEIFNRRGMIGPQQTLQSTSEVFRLSFNPALQALSDIAVLVTMTIALTFVVDPILVISAVVLLGLVSGGLLMLTRRLLSEMGRRRMQAERALLNTMHDGFRGLIDMLLGNRQDAVIARFRHITANFALVDRRAWGLQITPRALNEILLAGAIVVAAVYFSAAAGGMQGALSTLAVMGFAGLRMAASISRLAEILQRMRQNEPERLRLLGAIREIAPDLLQERAPAPAENYLVHQRPLPAGRSHRLSDRVTLEGISFTYPEAAEPAIRDISLQIRRGDFVGLCGPSGGGKSTLALVIMGLIRPQTGRVLCDGWDIFKHPSAWYANIGYVGQTPFISPRTVRENVAFGYEPHEIDDDAVWRVLKAASLSEVIRERPEGLDAFLGEEGVLLSGGQRQRLSIARALYRDPDVLVFDEATAALDNLTEKEVSDAIKSMSHAKTVICIAHRLSTIRDCSIIHYIEGGRIVASGTYEELEIGCSAFRRLALVAEPVE